MTLNYGQSCSFSHYKTSTKFGNATESRISIADCHKKFFKCCILLDEVGRQLLHVESTKVILKLAYLKPDR